MGGVIAGLIARCGCPVRLYNAADSMEVTGLLQPVRHGDPLRDWSALGRLEAGSHVLYTVQCPGDFDMVECGGARYWLRRWEAYRIGGEVLYYWAMLTKEDAVGTDL